MAAVTTSATSGIALNVSIETLIDLNSQVEHRKQERKLRQQERERKRGEELRRLEKEVHEICQDQATTLTIEPQPSKSKSSDRLQKLEKELEEMRRTRRSRRLSHTQEPSKDIFSTPTVAAEEKEIKTLKSEETDNRVLEEVVEKEIVSENTSQQIAENKEVTPFQATNVSGLVAKAKERFGKQEDVQPVISKYRQKELSIPIAKKIVSVEKKEVANPQSVKVDTQKLPNQDIVPSLTTSKEQPKKSVLSRYAVISEVSSTNFAQKARPLAIPIRTTTSLAERAAIFKEVKQPDRMSPSVLSKQKSTPLPSFQKKVADEENDDESVNISPSVCVSHRFGQPPQVIARKAWPTVDEKESSKNIKKDLVSSLQRHPAAKKRLTSIITEDKATQRVPGRSEEEISLSSSPVEIRDIVIPKVSNSDKTSSHHPQDLMTRNSPPLKHAKKPIKPKSHKSKKRLVEEVVPEEPEEEMFDQVIMTTEPEPIELIHQEEENNVEAAENEVLPMSTRKEEPTSTPVSDITEKISTKLMPVISTSSRPKVAATTTPLKQVEERKPSEENEANAIRARILAKRMSSSALESKAKVTAMNRPSKPTTDDTLPFLQIRASLGKKGTETFRAATEKKVEQRGGPLTITTHRWSTSSVPLAVTSERKPQPKPFAKRASEANRPSLDVLPHTSKSASIVQTTTKTEHKAEPRLIPNIKLKVEQKVDQEVVRKIEIEEAPASAALDVKEKDGDKTEKPVKRVSQYTREHFKPLPTQNVPVQKHSKNYPPVPPTGRASLKKRAYSVSDLKAIHKKFEQAELSEKPLPLLRSPPKEITQRTVEMPTPVKAVPEFIQTHVSNLQIVSPIPRKLSPEPFALSAEQPIRTYPAPISVSIPAHGPEFDSSTVPVPAPALSTSSGQEQRNWRVRKELPFKLDMSQFNNPQINARQQRNSHQEPEAGVVEREVQDNTKYHDTTQYDECIAISRRRASMPVPESYLRETVNRSPAGSDDSELLDTPKEGKKVSFSPTITTFRLDPVEEYEDANQDYFGSASKRSKLLDNPYGDLDQVSMPPLPPPIETKQSTSRHQRTMSAPYDNAPEHPSDPRDTSAFWKAFSSEMTNVPHIYNPTDRDSRASMLPQPDRPDNYYNDSNRNQRCPPSWVKSSLEGGRPEPSVPAASSWRQSSIWDNLFGRKNNDKL